jgi:hypothetical protein
LNFKGLVLLVLFMSSNAFSGVIHGEFSGYLSSDNASKVLVDVYFDQNAIVVENKVNEYTTVFSGGDWLDYSLSVAGHSVKISDLASNSVGKISESVYMTNGKPLSGRSEGYDILELNSYFSTVEVNETHQVISHSYSFLSFTDLTGELLQGLSLGDLDTINLNFETTKFVRGFYNLQHYERDLLTGDTSNSINKTFGQFIINESKFCIESCVAVDENVSVPVSEPATLLIFFIGFVLLIFRRYFKNGSF